MINNHFVPNRNTGGLMETYISENVMKIELSGIRKFYNKVAQYPDAISLTLGQPDFNVPERVKKAMIEAINENKTSYTSNAGILPLRQEISKYLLKNNIKYNAEEICITVGGSEALLTVFTSFINPGDKVLIPTPAYPAYESCVKLIGGEVVNYTLNEEFGIDIATLEKVLVNEKPKLLVLSFPSNPTGAVLKKQDKEQLYKIIKKHDVIVISDEIYSSLCFEDELYSIAQYEDLLDKVILIGGFSKMLSMTGLRIGYLCAKEEVMKHLIKVHQYAVSCAPSIAQWGAYEGLKSCSYDIDLMKNSFKERSMYLFEKLTLLGFDCVKPSGAFYIFPSIKKFGLTSEEFCERALKEAKVAIVPGSAFGKGGEGFVRISYSYSMKELEAAMKRLEEWIKAI